MQEPESDEFNGKNYVYSREFTPNATRFETVFSSFLCGKAGGLAALHAALTLLNPCRVSVGDGYLGSHEFIAVISRLSGLQKLPLECAAESLDAGDVILLETPVNPFGTAFSIEEYAHKAHSRGAFLIVDSTFAPPGLQDPFLWGADFVMHSGSKYLGGHSDLICGVLATKRADWTQQLFEDRLALGNVMGNMDSWLGIRDLRTLEVSVRRASQNSAKLISWLDRAMKACSPSFNGEEAIVQSVLQKQMPSGFEPVFRLSCTKKSLRVSYQPSSTSSNMPQVWVVWSL